MGKCSRMALVLISAALCLESSMQARAVGSSEGWPQYVADAVPGSGPTKDGLQFSLDSPKDVFRSDERVEVMLHLRNVAARTRPLSWKLAPWYRGFTLVVTDISGNAVPRQLDKSETDPRVLSYGFSMTLFNIDPGKELRVGLADLGEYFPLVPGRTYFVTAELTVTNSDKSGVVQLISNTLRVKLASGVRDPGLSLVDNSPGGGEIVEGTQLLIDTSKRHFNAGEAVDLTLNLKNFRAGPMAYAWLGGPWFWYGNNVILKVVDEAGFAVDRKLDDVENELPENRPNVAYKELEIPVGQELRIPLPDLRKYFALVPGGTYRITASCGAWGSDRQGITVTSNTIEVTLSEP